MVTLRLMECPNCHKQVETDGSKDDKCYWCREPLVGKMPISIPRPHKTDTDTSATVKKPKKGGYNRETRKRMLENKDQVIRDYISLPERGANKVICDKWNIVISTWKRFKRLWYADIAQARSGSVKTVLSSEPNVSVKGCPPEVDEPAQVKKASLKPVS